MVAKVGQT